MLKPRCSLMMVTVVSFVLNVGVLCAQEHNAKTLERRALTDLKAEFGDRIAIKVSRATNKLDFVRLRSDAPGGLTTNGSGLSEHEKATAFLRSRGQIFGLRDPDTELTRGIFSWDGLGGSHLTYTQNYKGVPVFVTNIDDIGRRSDHRANCQTYMFVDDFNHLRRANSK